MKHFPLDHDAQSLRSNGADVKARVIERARALGASDVRVAAAATDAIVLDRLRESFERGDLGTWPYDDAYAQRASDGRSLLPGAKSVICIAVPYATQQRRRRHLQGRVSNYAWSTDYHVRMREVLKELAKLIDTLADSAVTAIACDTKPMAERAFAASAGLGWVGKHTNLIAGAGSFVFLGEIVTTLDLPLDAPLKKTCGACARCVTACPTGALRGDYTIDANRCIADLTQRTDAIPRELRAMIGDWIWGCDLCQDVCPPTQLAGSTADKSFAPADDDVAAPSLVALLQLKSGEFKRRYARTAMGWRGAAVLRRNAAIGLGNALDRSAVPALAQALESDPHAMVRGACAWALGRIGSAPALQAIQRRLDFETDEGVREELQAALEPLSRREPLGRT